MDKKKKSSTKYSPKRKTRETPHDWATAERINALMYQYPNQLDPPRSAAALTAIDPAIYQAPQNKLGITTPNDAEVVARYLQAQKQAQAQASAGNVGAGFSGDPDHSWIPLPPRFTVEQPVRMTMAVDPAVGMAQMPQDQPPPSAIPGRGRARVAHVPDFAGAPGLAQDQQLPVPPQVPAAYAPPGYNPMADIASRLMSGVRGSALGRTAGRMAAGEVGAPPVQTNPLMDVAGGIVGGLAGSAVGKLAKGVAAGKSGKSGKSSAKGARPAGVVAAADAAKLQANLAKNDRIVQGMLKDQAKREREAANYKYTLPQFHGGIWAQPLDPGLQNKLNSMSQVTDPAAGWAMAGRFQGQTASGVRNANSAKKAQKDAEFVDFLKRAPQTKEDSYKLINSRRIAAGLPPLVVPNTKQTEYARMQADRNKASVANKNQELGRMIQASNMARKYRVPVGMLPPGVIPPAPPPLPPAPSYR